MAASELRPHLTLVPTGAIRFHEHPERRRTLRLVERLRSDALLRNPPIVADMHDGHYLLLDGANRVSAFAELGLTHVPVQVVDYGDPEVQLKGWHHLVLEGRSLGLRERYAALPGVRLEPLSHDSLGHHLELRTVYAVLVEDQRTCAGLLPVAAGEIDVEERLAVLEQVVSAYEGQSGLERIKLADYDQLSEAFRSVEHQLVLYPALHKGELLHLAARGIMIPTGLTRHLIPGRALGINVGLAFLSELDDSQAKQAHFQRFIEDLDRAGRIRFYEEPVFIMNE